MSNATIEHYNKTAIEFVNSTKDMNASKYYDFFLPHLMPHSHILDLGCGSGRDSKVFLDMRYRVTSIDGASELVKIATELTGQDVICARFDELDYNEEFDGIWAFASIFHAERHELKDIFNKIRLALKPAGFLYCSFPAETFTSVNKNLCFTEFSLEDLSKFLEPIPELSIINSFIQCNTRFDGVVFRWLNVLIQRANV